MRNTKITERQFLKLLEHGQSRAELLESCGEGYGLGTRAVDKNIGQAVAAGLAEALPDPTDGRRRIYALTQAGKDLLASKLVKGDWGYRQRIERKHALAHDTATAEIKQERREQRLTAREQYGKGKPHKKRSHVQIGPYSATVTEWWPSGEPRVAQCPNCGETSGLRDNGGVHEPSAGRWSCCGMATDGTLPMDQEPTERELRFAEVVRFLERSKTSA